MIRRSRSFQLSHCVKTFWVVASLVFVSACSDTIREPATVCPKDGSRLTAIQAERLALTSLLASKRKIETLHGGEIHFFKYMDSPSGDKDGDIKTKIDKYLAEFPNCCSVVRPSYVKNTQLAKINGDFLQFWDIEVIIRENPPFILAKDRAHFVRAMSACGDHVSYVGVDHAMLE